MLKALIKARLASFWAGFGYDRKTGKRRKTGTIILMGALYVYLVAVFLFLFLMLFIGLGTVTLADGALSWLYFAMAGAVATLLALVGSLFATVTQLYEAKDNDLLLSMPIPPRTILLSRLLFLYLTNLAFEAVVLLPALAVYVFLSIPMGVFSIWALLSLLVALAVLPVVGLTLSCLFGWLVALLLRRVRRKSLVQTVFSLILLGLYFYLYFGFLGNADEIENIAAMLPNIAQGVKLDLFPFYIFGVGCAGSIPFGLLSLLMAGVPAALVFLLLSRSFIGIATAKAHLKKAEYHEKSVKPASVRKALAKKDLGFLFHSSSYLLNSAMGLFMLVVAAVALAIMKPTVLGFFADPELLGFMGMEELAALLTAAICLLLSMTMITAPSISIEAKTLWLLRSSPIRAQDVLLAKVYASEVLTVPVTLLASASVLFVTTPPWYTALGVILLPQLFGLFGTLFGMILGALFPRFSWMNEAEAVKQGLAAFLSMFGLMGIAFVSSFIGLALAALLGADTALLLLSLVFLGLSVLLTWILHNPISRKFNSLYT